MCFNKKNWRGRQLANERGSMTVFIVVLIPVLLTMIILIADIGQLIFERIRLQTTVDACALAAATVQAVGLNDIADLNSEVKSEYFKVKRILASGIWNSHGEAQRVIQFFSQVFNALTFYRNEANTYFARQSWEYARQVQVKNLPDAVLKKVPGSSFDRLIKYRKIPQYVQFVHYSLPCKFCLPTPTQRWYNPDDPRFFGIHDGSYTLPSKRTMPLLGTHQFRVLWKKITPPVTYAALELSQKSKGFILGNRLFDLTSPLHWRAIPREYQPYIKSLRMRMRMPKMVAYAAAKPTGGNVLGGDPDYRAILTLLRDLNPLPGIPNIERMEH